MKDRAETTLFETDTILIYTGNYLLLNSIIEDSLESTRILLGGAYRDRYILNESEIIDLHKELNAVDYMDVVNAKVFVGEIIKILFGAIGCVIVIPVAAYISAKNVDKVYDE